MSAKRFRFLVALLAIVSLLFCCNSRLEDIEESIQKAKQNLPHYRTALTELQPLSEAMQRKKGIFALDGNQMDSLLEAGKERFSGLRFLRENDLIAKRYLVAYTSKGQSFDFVFDSSQTSWIVGKITGRTQITHDCICFDPKKTWLERKSIVGVTDDYGIEVVKELEQDWYFVSYWNAEEK
jgi:hypothetical protein